MAARKAQFVLGSLGCLAAGTLDIVGLSTCHWTHVSDTTMGLWTCCHGNVNGTFLMGDRGGVECNRLSWDSLPTYFVIIRILAFLIMVFFLISLVGLVTGSACQRTSKVATSAFLLARLQEIGTMTACLLTMLLVAIYITNRKDLTSSEDQSASIGYSFILCVAGLGLGIISAINLCCGRGYRDYQRVQKKNLHLSHFRDY